MSDRLEWLRWRQKGIGASDAAALHGKSPYVTRHELGEQKLAKEIREQEDNFVTRLGNELEPIARQKFAALYNMEHGTNEVFEPRRVEMAELPFIRASLDGASSDLKTLVEFKFMSKPREHGKSLTLGQQKHMDVLNGTVPEHYRIQVQHQLLVTGADVCHFASFDGESLHTCKVFPDVDFLKKHIDLCVEFWELVIAGKSQPIGIEDFKELRGAAKIAQRWKQLTVRAKEIEAEIAVLREKLIELSDHPRMICSGVKIMKCEGRKGSIDWQKAFLATGQPEEAAESFRKLDGAPFYKLSFE